MFSYYENEESDDVIAHEHKVLSKTHNPRHFGGHTVKNRKSEKKKPELTGT